MKMESRYILLVDTDDQFFEEHCCLPHSLILNDKQVPLEVAPEALVTPSLMGRPEEWVDALRLIALSFSADEAFSVLDVPWLKELLDQTPPRVRVVELPLPLAHPRDVLTLLPGHFLAEVLPPRDFSLNYQPRYPLRTFGTWPTRVDNQRAAKRVFYRPQDLGGWPRLYVVNVSLPEFCGRRDVVLTIDRAQPQLPPWPLEYLLKYWATAVGEDCIDDYYQEELMLGHLFHKHEAESVVFAVKELFDERASICEVKLPVDCACGQYAWPYTDSIKVMLDVPRTLSNAVGLPLRYSTDLLFCEWAEPHNNLDEGGE